MKKFLINFLLVLCVSSLLIGCSKEKVEEVKLKDEFEVEVATEVVENYFKSLKNNNYEESNKYLTEKIKNMNVNEDDFKIKTSGYRIDGINESDNKAYFTVNVTGIDRDGVRSMLSKYVILVKKEDMEYKIDKIDASSSREIFAYKDSLRMRFDDAIETSLLLDMDGISNYAYPKDDPGKLGMINIPKRQFSTLSVDYEGDLVAFTTADSNVYIGIAAVDETAKTATGEDGKEDSGSDKESDKGPKEKPIGKRIITCDLLIDASVMDMCFSEDEKFLVVQYTTADGFTCFRVYETESGELIKEKLENEFPLNSVDVAYKFFEKDMLIFSVISKGDSDVAKKFIGEYNLDLNTFEIKKVA